MKAKRLAAAAAVVGASAAAYERWLKPWQQRWGATDEELALVLPGDDLVAEPATQVTRAITIGATREQVWPWLVQLGADRGGFYTYDRLENLFGLGIHSADDIVEEWQDLQIGDVVHADRGRTGGWYVAELRPREVLVLEVGDLDAGRPLRRDEDLRWEFQWTFALRDAPGGGTRLLVRERVAFDSVITRALMAPVGFVSFVMTRGMLLGIKARVEARREPAPVLRFPTPASGSADRTIGPGRAPRPPRSADRVGPVPGTGRW
ncbi:MAG: SRPBCC family protein [Actinomycetota bacterium]|nr:SRPBCC family protein [Actinomycetota bacterium]